MCAIFGGLISRHADINIANRIMEHIATASKERGRDGYGYENIQGVKHLVYKYNDVNTHLPFKFFVESNLTQCGLGNLRAEPTTEYVQRKTLADQQPYRNADWTIVHNGTIANDKELRVQPVLTNIDSGVIPQVLSGAFSLKQFTEHVKQLKGSYAILAYNTYDDNAIYVACNYRPIWYIQTDCGIFFASSRSYFPQGFVPQMLTPYTTHRFLIKYRNIFIESDNLYPTIENKKALVVCSGGLDSVVAASAMVAEGYEIELIHFLYGSRAEKPEVKAVQDVGKALKCKVTLFPLPVYKPSDSPLLDVNSTVAGGEAGAEFAYEWVPARNLLLLSVAIAYAEANGFDNVVLGNNLEEAGAYPDNEPEFIAKFNDMLPFAVGDGKRMKIKMPVGNLMKHEIVKLGVSLKAPLHLTWSCYRGSLVHCGKCGPCFMRKTAFQINNIPEVIQYAHN